MLTQTKLRREIKRQKVLGRSQKALSPKATLNETAVEAIENGKPRNARGDTLEAVARVLGYTANDLLRPGRSTARTKRFEYIEGSQPATVLIQPDNEGCKLYEPPAEEITVLGRIMERWRRL